MRWPFFFVGNLARVKLEGLHAGALVTQCGGWKNDAFYANNMSHNMLHVVI